ncbi:hypothetical protein BV20DRAFT_596918 [Pilatotrama ljubarskyi]|nr:hypothetical protein BV20DRAFT_596918 [Pilatotrama ljubarskyi]
MPIRLAAVAYAVNIGAATACSSSSPSRPLVYARRWRTKTRKARRTLHWQVRMGADARRRRAMLVFATTPRRSMRWRAASALQSNRTVISRNRCVFSRCAQKFSDSLELAGFGEAPELNGPGAGNRINVTSPPVAPILLLRASHSLWRSALKRSPHHHATVAALWVHTKTQPSGGLRVRSAVGMKTTLCGHDQDDDLSDRRSTRLVPACITLQSPCVWYMVIPHHTWDVLTLTPVSGNTAR